MREARPTEPVHTTINKIANGMYSIVNTFTGKVITGLTKEEARAKARAWDVKLGLAPKASERSKSGRKRFVDDQGNELPTKTEIIIEMVIEGYSWKEIAAAARCRYQMAHNVGTRYLKSHPADEQTRNENIKKRQENKTDANI